MRKKSNNTVRKIIIPIINGTRKYAAISAIVAPSGCVKNSSIALIIPVTGPHLTALTPTLHLPQ